MATASSRCRLHGGASPGAQTGAGNDDYEDGLRAKEAMAQQGEGRARLRALLKLLRENGG